MLSVYVMHLLFFKKKRSTLWLSGPDAKVYDLTFAELVCRRQIEDVPLKNLLFQQQSLKRLFVQNPGPQVFLSSIYGERNPRRTTVTTHWWLVFFIKETFYTLWTLHIFIFTYYNIFIVPYIIQLYCVFLCLIPIGVSL